MKSGISARTVTKARTATTVASTSKPRRKAVTWRSGLEEANMRDLDERGVPYRYEEVKVRYDKPATSHTYTPDLILKNGIIVATKGIFDVTDRRKHELNKAQHTGLELGRSSCRELECQYV